MVFGCQGNDLKVKYKNLKKINLNQNLKKIICAKESSIMGKFGKIFSPAKNCLPVMCLLGVRISNLITILKVNLNKHFSVTLVKYKEEFFLLIRMNYSAT